MVLKWWSQAASCQRSHEPGSQKLCGRMVRSVFQLGTLRPVPAEMAFCKTAMIDGMPRLGRKFMKGGIYPTNPGRFLEVDVHHRRFFLFRPVKLQKTAMKLKKRMRSSNHIGKVSCFASWDSPLNPKKSYGDLRPTWPNRLSSRRSNISVLMKKKPCWGSSPR